MAASVHYVHKQLDRTIEDTGALDADGNEVYIIANPGEGLVTSSTSLRHERVPAAGAGVYRRTRLITMPKAKRDYDSVEFALEKRFANNWLLTAATCGAGRGNYSGLSPSDENGRDNPNISRDFDYPAMMFDQTGKVIDGCSIPTARTRSRPRSLPVQLRDTSVGVNQYP